MTTRSNRNVRMRKSVEVLEWVEALPAVTGGAIPDGLAVVTDYLSYWLDYEKGAVLSLGSIERYVLSWCEDPTENVIATLVNLGELASQTKPGPADN